MLFFYLRMSPDMMVFAIFLHFLFDIPRDCRRTRPITMFAAAADATTATRLSGGATAARFYS